MTPAALSHRRSIRLPGFDYRSPNACFVTLSAPHHEDRFGIRVGEEVRLNDIGQMVAFHVQALPGQFPIRLDAWMLMPNHLHFIIFLDGEQAQEKAASFPHPDGTLAGSLGAIVQNFKSVTTRKANRMLHTPGEPLWQRNYFERIIRTTQQLENTRRYICENAVKHARENLIDY